MAQTTTSSTLVTGQSIATQVGSCTSHNDCDDTTEKCSAGKCECLNGFIKSLDGNGCVASKYFI